MESKYIQNLKDEIKNTKVYSELNKKELNYVATAKKKMEILLNADPEDPDDILKYVLYVDSINGYRSDKILKKAQSLVKYSKLCNEKNKATQSARRIVAKGKRRRKIFIAVNIFLYILGPVGVFLFWLFLAQYWNLISKIIFWVVGFIVIETSHALINMSREVHDWNPYE